MLLDLPLPRRLAGLGLCLMVTVGCGDATSVPMPPSPNDGGDAAPVLGSRTLTNLGEDVLTLQAEELADISFAYRRGNGQPVADAEIMLALVGRADDSSLLELSILTDGSGEATGRIIAGSRPAIFRVRATADEAHPTYIDVSVSPSGFGTLRVTPVHEGVRMIAEYRVALFSGVTCTEGETMTRSPERELIVPADGAAEFPGLPAETPIVITVWGLSEIGHQVAYGCADEFMVTEDEVTEGEIELSDLNLALDGRYELGLTLANTAGSESAGIALEGAISALAGSRGSDAAFLLDSLHGSLLETPDLVTASMLAVLIEGGDAERELSRRLTAEGTGVSVAIGRAAETVRSMLGSFSIQGTLVFPTSTEEPATWMSQTIIVTRTSAGSMLSLPLSSITEDPSGSMRAEVDPISDRVIVREYALKLPLSGVAFQTFRAEIASIEPGSPGSRFATEIGCASLTAWVAGRPSLTTTCGTDCVNRACRRAGTDTSAAVAEALSSLDDRRSIISIAGEFEVTDEDGDLHPDTLDGESFEGVWTAPGRTEGDAIRAEVSGERAIGF